MTNAKAKDELLRDAEQTLYAALRWAETADLHAPIALKRRDQERIERARINLEAIRELVAE